MSKDTCLFGNSCYELRQNKNLEIPQDELNELLRKNKLGLTDLKIGTPDEVIEAGCEHYFAVRQHVDFISKNAAEGEETNPSFSMRYKGFLGDFINSILPDESVTMAGAAYKGDGSGSDDDCLYCPSVPEAQSAVELKTLGLGLQGSGLSGLGAIGGIGLLSELPLLSNLGVYGYAAAWVGAGLGGALSIQLTMFNKSKSELTGLMQGLYLAVPIGPVVGAMTVFMGTDMSLHGFGISVGTGLQAGGGVMYGAYIGV